MHVHQRPPLKTINSVNDRFLFPPYEHPPYEHLQGEWSKHRHWLPSMGFVPPALLTHQYWCSRLVGVNPVITIQSFILAGIEN